MVFYKLFACSFSLICTLRLQHRGYFASSSALFEWKVPFEFPVAVQWAILSCRLYFVFTENIFSFADGISLLPWHISFLQRDFFFCQDLFLFLTARIIILPGVFFFCPDLFLFSCDTCGPPYCSLLSANFEILKIAVLKNLQIRMKVMEFFFSKVGG